MKRVTYNPFESFNTLKVEDLLEDISGRSLGQFLGTEWVNTTPSINIIEQEQDYRIELAAPGLEKTDFDVAVEDDNLVISVSKQKPEGNSGKHLTREYDFSAFKRKFYLSEDIDRDKIDAVYELGVLTIELAKKVEKEEKVRTINII